MSRLEKLAYFIAQAKRRVFAANPACPNCDSELYTLLERKAVVTDLRECANCKLMYRFPVDPRDHGKEFYQEHYQQGFTTSMPSEAELQGLLSSRFKGHEKSYALHLSVLHALGIQPGARIFDYGCSWGYGSWQFEQAGYVVKSFELSRQRAAFARTHLGIDTLDNLETLAAEAETLSMDVFFSNHVIEHVPRPADVLDIARKILKPGGFFVGITPNGSLGYRECAPRNWRAAWGKVHPNLLSDTFWRRAFADRSHFVGSLPATLRELAAWRQSGGQVVASQSEPELLCVAKF